MKTKKTNYNFSTAKTGTLWCFNCDNGFLDCIEIISDPINVKSPGKEQSKLYYVTNNTSITKLNNKKCIEDIKFEKVLFTTPTSGEVKIGWVLASAADEYLIPYFGEKNI